MSDIVSDTLSNTLSNTAPDVMSASGGRDAVAIGETVRRSSIVIPRLEAIFTGQRAPGVYRWTSRAHPAAVAREARRNGWSCALLDGREITDTTSFVDACDRALRLPAYVRGNAQALEECLCDLSWLPPARGRVLLYDDGAALATAAPSEWTAVVELLRRAVAGHRVDQPALYVLVRGTPAARSLPLL